jgi:Na+/H+-translocating membrane pyrophosphatase
MAEPLKAVEADAKADDEGVLVPLVTDAGTVDILIPPAHMWFEGAVDALVLGQVSNWVHLAVEDEETLAAWDGAKKRYRDLSAFTDKWAELSGNDLGKSPSSANSSERKPTRRR